MSEDFTLERFRIIIRLYKVKEGNMTYIAETIGVSPSQLIKIKDWLLERKILIYQGKVFIKSMSGERTVAVEYYIVNHAAIDTLIFINWDETKILWGRSRNYTTENDFDKF